MLDRTVAQGIVSVKGVRQSGDRAGNWLTREHAGDLLAQPDSDTTEGKRDRAILAVLLGCALRRSDELAALERGASSSATAAGCSSTGWAREIHCHRGETIVDDTNNNDRNVEQGARLARRDFVALSVAAGFSAGSVSAADLKVIETNVEIKTPDGTCDAAFIHPASGLHPGVLIWTERSTGEIVQVHRDGEVHVFGVPESIFHPDLGAGAQRQRL